ncbi:MAG: FHA domain-containing protein [Chloroflexota bacterium]
MDNLEAILYLERGPQPNLRFALQQEETTIGRSAGNDLVLVDPEVSRRHARVVRQPHQFAVEDLGSTNGTFVNGQRVSSLTALQDADTIDLGDTVRLRFVLTSPPPAETVQPVPSVPETPPVYEAAVNIPADQPLVVEPDPVVAPVEAVVPDYSVPAGNYVPQNVAPPPTSMQQPTQRRGARNFWLGCGLLLALLLVCLGTFLLLDAFQDGRLLYCGPLRPIFEFLLGPFGFAPIC